jgi:hypothetical protein
LVRSVEERLYATVKPAPADEDVFTIILFRISSAAVVATATLAVWNKPVEPKVAAVVAELIFIVLKYTFNVEVTEVEVILIPLMPSVVTAALAFKSPMRLLLMRLVPDVDETLIPDTKVEAPLNKVDTEQIVFLLIVSTLPAALIAAIVELPVLPAAPTEMPEIALLLILTVLVLAPV